MKRFPYSLSAVAISILTIYFVLGFIFMSFNKFELSRAVITHRSDYCEPQPQGSFYDLSLVSPCDSDAVYREEGTFTWINWRFFSDYRGFNSAKYIPIDLGLIALGGAMFAYLKRRRKD